MEEIMENSAPERRELPNSQDSERALLGSMFMSEQAIVDAMEILDGSEFYNRAHGLMFESIVELYNESAGENKDMDPVLLQEKMKQKGALPEIASIAFITEIAGSVAISAKAKQYAKVVKEKAKLREIVRMSRKMEESCMEDSAKSSDILGVVEKNVFDMTEDDSENRDLSIKEIIVNSVDKICEVAQNGDAITGVSTGFKDLDDKLAGLQPSDMVLIAARPSMGKTALALNIAANVALKSNLPVAIFSLEMSKELLANRFLSMESHVEANKIRTGGLKGMEWDALYEAANSLSRSELIIDDHTGITLSYFASRCQKIKKQHPNLGLVVIDYLQLMQGSGKNDSRQQEVSDISRGIKQVAREIGAPIIALSQLSRAAEQRTDHRPMLSDLRESGAIEQDADVVMFIYRDDYYNPDTDKKGIAEVIIAKQRNGEVGTVELAWLGQYTQFANKEYSNSHFV